jgi:hypothetical protein
MRCFSAHDRPSSFCSFRARRTGGVGKKKIKTVTHNFRPKTKGLVFFPLAQLTKLFFPLLLLLFSSLHSLPTGKDRKLYLPAGLLNLNDDVPSYLNGTLAGDYGFDPLKLGVDGKITQYRAAEVGLHAS